jgi:cytochrome c oxidase cbb3-type subunit III
MSSRCRRRCATSLPAVLFVAAGLLGCEREERRFEPLPHPPAPTAVRQTGVQAGPPVVGSIVPGAPPGYSPYEKNAYGVSQGKTLYNQFNCAGCHSQGGGGMGPPLMDAQWIYGSRPENIFETISQGRPNGMPSFGGKIVEDQIWQIVAYVRSMSGLLRKDVAPGRSDDMQVRSQEQATERTQPTRGQVSAPAEGP